LTQSPELSAGLAGASAAQAGMAMQERTTNDMQDNNSTARMLFFIAPP
jgi:hypothetical protein